MHHPVATVTPPDRRRTTPPSLKSILQVTRGHVTLGEVRAAEGYDECERSCRFCGHSVTKLGYANVNQAVSEPPLRRRSYHPSGDAPPFFQAVLSCVCVCIRTHLMFPLCLNQIKRHCCPLRLAFFPPPTCLSVIFFRRACFWMIFLKIAYRGSPTWNMLFKTTPTQESPPGYLPQPTC